MKITDVAVLYSIENKNYPPVQTGMDIGWDSPTIGFGRLVLWVDEDGEVEIETERMDKEHFLNVMSALYDIAKVE